MNKLDSELITKIGLQIRSERKKLNLSQEAFANKTGLHRTFIGDIENGKRNISISTLKKIVCTFDMKLSEFFLLIEENEG